jgi:hypothetical protein
LEKKKQMQHEWLPPGWKLAEFTRNPAGLLTINDCCLAFNLHTENGRIETEVVIAGQFPYKHPVFHAALLA